MSRLRQFLPGIAVIVLLIAAWWLIVTATRSVIFPTPWQVVTGTVDLVRGTYSFAGRRFDLDDASVVRFEGGQVTNPSLQIAATSDIQGTAVTINITGRAHNPQIAFSSSPNLPQDELLSRILFGNSVGQLSAIQRRTSSWCWFSDFRCATCTSSSLGGRARRS